MEEIWKDIVLDNEDYTELYQISSLKRVRNNSGEILKDKNQIRLYKNNHFLFYNKIDVFEYIFDIKSYFYYKENIKFFLSIKELTNLEWKDIPDLSGYQACNLGIIRKKLLNTYSYFNPDVCKSRGYVNIHLDKTYKLHRLIAMTFLPINDESNNIVNHINEYKMDNRLENLEWCNSKENIIHYQLNNDFNTKYDSKFTNRVPLNTKFNFNDNDFYPLKNFPKYKINQFGILKNKKDQIIKILLNKTNNYTYQIKNTSNKKITILVRNCIIDAFLPEYDYNDIEIQYLDKDTSNNRLDNYIFYLKEEKINYYIPLINDTDIWKPLKVYNEKGELFDHSDKYIINDKGIVKNIKTNKIKKNVKNKKGYYVIGLAYNKIMKTYSIHRIVLSSFTDPKLYDIKRNVVDHIDNNTLNNNLTNLRWVTSKENSLNRKDRKNNL